MFGYLVLFPKALHGKANETRAILQILNDYNEENAIFLDIGANIGTHSIPVAVHGHQVWAVEPLANNIVKLYQASLLSRCNNNIHLFKNGLDMLRHDIEIVLEAKNMGGSHVNMKNGLGKNSKSEIIKSILLSDVINDIGKSYHKIL